ncbi:hypothetical protein EMPS_04350 [Entomortierella parvispora]|uniref:Uncharacterized protein n=1 Tax=Entomortierella parvispora TaxID=205924 RepID=A0A9P3LVE3_9FUNG|nr:hypothetical protein EMPS_04350 [Entomortierella parvispora]
MKESSPSCDFDSWLEGQKTLDRRRSIKTSSHGLEKPSCSSLEPDPYQKRRWSRPSARGEDHYQNQNQGQKQHERQYPTRKPSYTYSRSNSITTQISHLRVASIDDNHEKASARPVEIIDLTLDEDDDDNTSPQGCSEQDVNTLNSAGMELDSVPKIEPGVGVPLTVKDVAETDYDEDSDLEIDCDDAKDLDYREDSAFEEEEEDDDYEDDVEDEEEGNETSHQQLKRRVCRRRRDPSKKARPNKEGPNKDELEDEVMESGVVTLRRSSSLKASPSPPHSRSRSKTLVLDPSPPIPDVKTPMPDPESLTRTLEMAMSEPTPFQKRSRKSIQSIESFSEEDQSFIEEDQSLRQQQNQEIELGEVLWKVWCGAQGETVTAKKYCRYYRDVVLKYASPSRIRDYTDPVTELWRRQEEEEDKRRISTGQVHDPQAQV